MGAPDDSADAGARLRPRLLGRAFAGARRRWHHFASAADTATLGRAFEQAEPEHFAWQTNGPVVAAQERELVRAAFLPLGERVLDVGCGEGATYAHLDEPAGLVGLELFEAKVRFARERFPAGRFVCGSAEQLPFDSASFDQVIVRDLIHHLPAPERWVDEVHRVLTPDGRLDLLEPAGANPLIALHALSKPAERGELRSSERFLRGLLEGRFEIEQVERLQPLPLHRLVFHPELGSPALAEQPALRGLVAGVERLAGWLLPRFCWAYMHVRATPTAGAGHVG